MRIGVISDIHSNLPALEAVLAHLGRVDALWCLGDVVGYGPQPNECIARLEALGALAIPGNHDWAAIGRLGLEEFNPDAAAAARWTARQLTPASRAYLEQLPLTRVEGDFTLAHGSPREPIWEYILGPRVAAASFAHFTTRVCLVGHTHVPALFVCEPQTPALPPAPLRAEQVKGEYMAEGRTVRVLETGRRFILNPGSVGQPRDSDPRAAYLLLDLERGEATWKRVPYPIERTQALMAALGLPSRLIVRLSHGW